MVGGDRPCNSYPHGCTLGQHRRAIYRFAWIGAGAARQPAAWVRRQWNESPQAQEPVALGLSIVKPCFSIVSTKSIVAPAR
jgi:hypothetical protein